MGEGFGGDRCFVLGVGGLVVDFRNASALSRLLASARAGMVPIPRSAPPRRARLPLASAFYLPISVGALPADGTRRCLLGARAFEDTMAPTASVGGESPATLVEAAGGLAPAVGAASHGALVPLHDVVLCVQLRAAHAPLI